MFKTPQDTTGTLKHYSALLWELTKTDLKLRYAGSLLGFVWVFLKPFLTFAILLLVFSTFFGQHDPLYALNLLIGLVLFYYFSEGTTQLTDVLLKRENIILKLRFPRLIVIWSSLLSSLINFAASLLLFFILVAAFGGVSDTFGIQNIAWFVVSVTFLSLFIVGFGLFSSILQVWFRDLQQIWAIVLQLLFYATPIIYPLSILPHQLQQVILLNPLTIIVDFTRAKLLGTDLTVSLQSVIVLAIAIILIHVAGYYFFRYQVKHVVESM